jgi:hypothetical protein
MYSKLIIEGNSVYEIDEECICQKEQQEQKKKEQEEERRHRKGRGGH